MPTASKIATDKLDEMKFRGQSLRKLGDEGSEPSRFGLFATTLATFFLVEMGDKTQLATVALGAKYVSLSMVVIGTTLGMMAANVPAVLLGERLSKYVPLSKMRFVAAALFAIFGVLILLKVNIGCASREKRRAGGRSPRSAAL